MFPVIHLKSRVNPLALLLHWWEEKVGSKLVLVPCMEVSRRGSYGWCQWRRILGGHLPWGEEERIPLCVNEWDPGEPVKLQGLEKRKVFKYLGSTVQRRATTSVNGLDWQRAWAALPQSWKGCPAQDPTQRWLKQGSDWRLSGSGGQSKLFKRLRWDDVTGAWGVWFPTVELD